MFAVLLSILPTFIISYRVLYALNSGNYEKIMISTKYFNYTSDQFFEYGTSMSARKTVIPSSITNPADQDLIKYHRTTTVDSKYFAYKSDVQHDYYIAIFTFVETQFKNKGERVFHLKFGDDIVHTIDIAGEVGFGKILHKAIEFQIRQQMGFFNGSLPALNAYNYKTKQVRFVFESVVGSPKVEAFMLVQGEDSNQYLKQFLLHEQEKNTIPKQYISQKYRRQPKLSYRPLQGKDVIVQPKTQFQRIYDKFVCLKSIGCILCGIFMVHYKKILQKITSQYHILTSKSKNIKKQENQKDKKQ